MNAVRLLPLLGVLVLIGLAVSKANAQGQEGDDSGKVRIVKFHYDPQPARQDVVVFKYPQTPAPVIERTTIEGGKVEITGDTIKIDGGKVEITRQSRQ